MSIKLSKKQIKSALPKIENGLQQYLWLQAKVASSDNFHLDSEFRRKYNHFYKVRRSPEWQDIFYGLMARTKECNFKLKFILKQLMNSTGRLEASFASKLLATINPDFPVIDSVVLKNLDMRLPSPKEPDRISKVCEIHNRLSNCFLCFLQSKIGKYLVVEFKKKYPKANITKTKMLDLILWQTRDFRGG